MKEIREEVLAYIEEQKDADPVDLLLRSSPFEDFTMEEISAQIKGRQIARVKFPFLLDYPQYRYPVKLSLEQASSEMTALYKASLIGGKKLIDLTGGMGVDAIIMGKAVEQTTVIEQNGSLSELLTHNLKVLDRDNIKVCQGDGAEYIHSVEGQYDWIYIDPSRRIEGARKYDISDLEPDVLKLQSILLEKSENVLIKLSPMQDIHALLDQMKQISTIHYVSYRGELKEILVELKKTANEIIHKCVLLDSSDEGVTWKTHEWCGSEGAAISYSDEEEYLYLPDVAFLKAGRQDDIAAQFHLQKMHPFTHIYTSDEVQSDYPGRCYKVLNTLSLKKKEVGRYLSSPFLNVISKNHPLTAQQIKKKLGVQDGGDHYLICFTGMNDRKVASICAKVF